MGYAEDIARGVGSAPARTGRIVSYKARSTQGGRRISYERVEIQKYLNGSGVQVRNRPSLHRCRGGRDGRSIRTQLLRGESPNPVISEDGEAQSIVGDHPGNFHISQVDKPVSYTWSKASRRPRGGGIGIGGLKVVLAGSR